ncbi:hypothetical protein SYNPS1DRAFT_31400 [Syncephalis pseudoplumigaleata]|uniref:Uncharacterized protein n=1 Tax=Syncephalis pseudoplumigaleata TaxID=1712513 RepID=A0A4P9YT42_9FUNG|nr:hypothetical protein SYNPS1DRAFT_31400 [Syncephalis pseudoplumigaleata]|eukprot:RKP22925.1 hypothetical protein SYNPS1DRAFT_31400 [Syncephalis pseudoplumigaleata]
MQIGKRSTAAAAAATCEGCGLAASSPFLPPSLPLSVEGPSSYFVLRLLSLFCCTHMSGAATYEDVLRECVRLAHLCGENLRCMNTSLERALNKTEPAVAALHAALHHPDADADAHTDRTVHHQPE